MKFGESIPTPQNEEKNATETNIEVIRNLYTENKKLQDRIGDEYIELFSNVEDERAEKFVNLYDETLKKFERESDSELSFIDSLLDDEREFPWLGDPGKIKRELEDMNKQYLQMIEEGEVLMKEFYPESDN